MSNVHRSLWIAGVIVALACRSSDQGPADGSSSSTSESAADDSSATPEPEDDSSTGPGAPHHRECAAALECPPGDSCIDGMCVSLGCGPGQCPECSEEVACSPGIACQHGFCVPPVSFCSTTPQFDPRPLPAEVGGVVEALAFVQLDADAARELIVGTQEGLWVVDGELPAVFIGSSAVEAIVAGDLDGDGDLDLVTRSGVELRTLRLAAGALAPWATLEGTFIGLDAADVDGDGADDVLVTRASADRHDLLLLRSQADGELGDAIVISSALDIPAVKAGTLDYDGFADVVAHVEGATQIWAGASTLDANPASTAVDLIDAAPSLGLHMAVGAEGRRQVLTVHVEPRETAVAFATGIPHVVRVPTLAVSAVTGDVDDDGIAELLLGGAGTIAVIRWPPSECYSLFGVPHDATILAVGDHDGDGAGDVAMSDGTTTTILIRRLGP